MSDPIFSTPTPTHTPRQPRMPTPAMWFAPFVRQKTVLLTTYRRDGTPVGNPVNMAVEGDHAFVRTYAQSWKFKRLRHNPAVTIAPSTVRGRPTGPAIRAQARRLGGEEAAHAARLLAHKYPLLQGVIVPVFHRLRRYRTVHFELTPQQSVPNAAAGQVMSSPAAAAAPGEEPSSRRRN